jgi:hypothetical protein
MRRWQVCERLQQYGASPLLSSFAIAIPGGTGAEPGQRTPRIAELFDD